jgi:hypothetical protein
VAFSGADRKGENIMAKKVYCKNCKYLFDYKHRKEYYCKKEATWKEKGYETPFEKIPDRTIKEIIFNNWRAWNRENNCQYYETRSINE